MTIPPTDGPRPAPTLIVVAGPNGSGKSTFFDLRIRGRYVRFVNADEIANGRIDVPIKQKSLRAAEEANALRHKVIAQRTSFAFETVFNRTEYWIEFNSRVARTLVDELWLYDNTAWSLTPRLVGRFGNGQVQYRSHLIPPWAAGFFEAQT
jgi:predicted ABC-type ATPase